MNRMEEDQPRRNGQLTPADIVANIARVGRGMANVDPRLIRGVHHHERAQRMNRQLLSVLNSNKQLWMDLKQFNGIDLKDHIVGRGILIDRELNKVASELRVAQQRILNYLKGRGWVNAAQLP